MDKLKWSLASIDYIDLFSTDYSGSLDISSHVDDWI